MVLYTGLLLALWLIVRLIAMSMTIIWKYLGDKSDQFDQPIKVDPFLNGVKFAVSYWTERGGRPYQEDRFQAIKAVLGDSVASLYGVFDGHGGEKAAEFCKHHLLQAVVADPHWQEQSLAKAATNAFFK